MTEWRKSSYSGGGSSSGDCVELAGLEAAVGMRDSKNPACGHFEVSRSAFGALLETIKVGKADL